MSKKNGKRTGLRVVLTALCIVLGIVLAVMLGGTIYAEYLLNQVNYIPEDETQPTLSAEELLQLEQELEEEAADPEFTGPELTDEDVSFGEGPQVEIAGEEIINILLIGKDGSGSRSRTDSMILCTFNVDDNTITLTSFMRDMYVKIPGHSNSRINAAYAYGGMKLLNETLYENFGIQVDGNVEVDFDHFEDVINYLGGVTLELTKSEAAYINKWVPNKRVGSGIQKLNGAQALMHARNRNSTDGDFSRTSRQRQLLTALVNEYKSKSLTEMVGMMDDILPMVSTDISKGDILDYVTELAPMLASAELISQRIPIDGSYRNASIDGASVLVVDMDMNRIHLVETLMGPGVG